MAGYKFSLKIEIFEPAYDPPTHSNMVLSVLYGFFDGETQGKTSLFLKK